MTTDLEERYLALVHANEARIRRICRIYAHDADASNDLYQDIALQLWRSLPSFEGDSQASTWLYRVALNTALAHRRRDTLRRVTRLDDAAPSEVLDRHPSPHARLEERQQLDRLYAGIDRLGDVQKAMVMMFLDDRSYREIAEVLGMSESNVGVKLHRLKKQLASWLAEEGP